MCFSLLLANQNNEKLITQSDPVGNWRFSAGGFGRGNIRTDSFYSTSDRAQVYGADMDVQYKILGNQKANLWVGLGGAFSPNQEIYSKRGGQLFYNRHMVDLGYGELRLMLVPEWKVSEQFFLGLRVGYAFDWLRVKCRKDSLLGYQSDVETEVEFTVQAILGVQALYMLTEYLGFYATCDYRHGGSDTSRWWRGLLPDATSVAANGERYDIELNGLCVSAGIVVQF
jgi:hypothetical protein